MRIGGLQKTTLIDYPGRVAATVFLMSCNFRCPWCYSPELVLPKKIKNQPKISEKDFFDFLKERKGLLDGVCITGGEPTINKDLPDFIKKIKKLGYLVKIDTNGSAPQMLKNLIEEKLIDYVAMDIKAPREKYEEVAGRKININNIEKNIKILKESIIDHEFRTTVVPTIHSKEDIIKIANWIGPAKKYYLQNFRPDSNPPTALPLRRAPKHIDPKFEKIKPYPQEYLIEIQKAISPFFEICQIR